MEDFFSPGVLNEIRQNMDSFFVKNLKWTDMTAADAKYILLIKWKSDINLTTLSDILCVDKAYTTRRINKLMDLGYIVKQAGNNNKEVIMQLTDKGEIRADEAILIMKKWDKILFSGIKEEDVEVFMRTFEKIRENIINEIKKMKSKCQSSNT